MAKKKGTRRKSYKKKSKRSKPKAKPVGLAGGAALSGADMLTSVSEAGQISILEALTYPYANTTTRVKAIASKATYQVTQPGNYKYVLLGMLVSAAPRIPVVGIIAKPADRGLKRLTKGKWGL